MCTCVNFKAFIYNDVLIAINVYVYIKAIDKINLNNAHTYHLLKAEHFALVAT